MKRVEQVRERILRGQMHELMRLRTYLSTLGENQEAVDALHGESGDIILAEVADFILRKLGHQAGSAPAASAASTVRRAVNRKRA